MSDRDLRVEPTPAVSAPAPVQVVRHAAPVAARIDQKRAPEPATAAATTGGSLRAAYAQYAVNPDTHDVIIRIRDSATDQVISETPSVEVEAMTKYLSDYAANMGRRRAATTSGQLN
jgi:hypothetical protein